MIMLDKQFQSPVPSSVEAYLSDEEKYPVSPDRHVEEALLYDDPRPKYHIKSRMQKIGVSTK